MSISFVGIVAPPLNTPLIDFEMPDGSSLDLYNDAWLRSAVIEQGTLTFVFEATDGSDVVVRFGAVRNLRATQPEDWVPEEADQIDHLLVRPDGQRPQVHFIAGGITYEFDASALSIQRTPEASASAAKRGKRAASDRPASQVLATP